MVDATRALGGFKMIAGKVGAYEVHWDPVPVGVQGESLVQIIQNGRLLLESKVHWKRDQQRIIIQSETGYHDYQVRKTLSEEGFSQYALVGQKHSEVVSGVKFLRPGEEKVGGTSAQSKKSFRVRAQIPGKVVKVFVKPNDVVKAGQPLLVMEAMKMENEIKAQDDLTVQEVKVIVGQNVEGGADLILLKKSES